MNVIQQLANKVENRKDQHDAMRKRVWSNAWAAVASAFNSKDPAVATRWADEALKAFDERFPKPDGVSVSSIMELVNDKKR